MEKKIRIQKFDSEGRLIDDRMVSQDTEFTSGPKLKHEGPLRVEFSLLDKSDVEGAVTYLGKLTGSLPIEAKKLKKLKEPQNPEHREQLLKDALGEAHDQDTLITYLRDHGFKFMMHEFLETFDWPMLILRNHHKEEFQWMLRCSKIAKNPTSDKYDPMLAFGIKLVGDRQEKVVIYLHGEFHKSYKIPLPDKPRETFKKSGMMKFPHFMVENERDKFRFEIRQYQNNPEKEFSKFFNRWREHVDNVPKLPQDKKVSD